MNEENVPTACRNKQLKKTLGKENENKRNHVSICRVLQIKNLLNKNIRNVRNFIVRLLLPDPLIPYNHSQKVNQLNWLSAQTVGCQQKAFNFFRSN